MKLIELIPFLLDNDKLPSLYTELNLDENSEEILIFMKESIDLNSEILLIEWEKTEGEMQIVVNDKEYIYFFSIDYASELIEEDLNLKSGYTHSQISERLLTYRLNDA